MSSHTTHNSPERPHGILHDVIAGRIHELAQSTADALYIAERDLKIAEMAAKPLAPTQAAEYTPSVDAQATMAELAHERAQWEVTAAYDAMKGAA